MFLPDVWWLPRMLRDDLLDGHICVAQVQPRPNSQKNPMLKFLRKLLFIPSAAVTRAQAEEIARQECEKQGWPWNTPIWIHEGLFYFHVRTNVNYRGGNVNVWIRVSTGRVVKAAFVER
jgi:hypothetical protein